MSRSSNKEAVGQNLLDVFCFFNKPGVLHWVVTMLGLFVRAVF